MECKYYHHEWVYQESIWINRYIMECKYLKNNSNVWCMPELIDTLWNVN